MAQNEPESWKYILGGLGSLGAMWAVLRGYISRSKPGDEFDAAYIKTLRKDIEDLKIQTSKALSVANEAKDHLHDAINKLDEALKGISVLVDRGKRG